MGPTMHFSIRFAFLTSLLETGEGARVQAPAAQAQRENGPVNQEPSSYG